MTTLNPITQDAIINARGREYLRRWIESTRANDGRKPVYLSDDVAISYWCADAEQSLAAGNGAIVEMPARGTLSGRTETYTIPADGIDWWRP